MITSLLTALTHSSALPLGSRFRKVTEGREGEVLVFFPLAGLIAGAVPAAVLVLALRPLGLSQGLSAALAIVAMAAVTGAANLVNLAATADAIGSGKSGAEPLNVDPAERVGAYGIAAVVLALLVKFTALTALISDMVLSFPGMVLAIVLVAALSRWAAVVLAAYSEYARPEGGPDEWMIRYCGAREFRWSLVLVAILAAGVVSAWMLGKSQLGWSKVILATFGCFAVGLVGSMYLERRFGGVTSRQLGAATEIAEVLALVMCALPTARFG
jgi:adenosylcobinamide-GDP ribazoletransferase